MGTVQPNIVGLIPGDPQVMEDLPNGHTETILLDSSQPNFIIKVPTPRLVAPLNLKGRINLKPVIGSPIMGFWPPVLGHFWPIWEATGADVQDTVIGDQATITGTSVSRISNSDPTYGSPWSGAQSAIRRTAVTQAVHNALTQDVVLTQPVTLSGGWSLDYCWRKPGGTLLWTHTAVTHDPVKGITGYTMGQPNLNYATTSANDAGAVSNLTPLTPGLVLSEFEIVGLFQALGYLNGGAVELEYLRIWRRVLNQVEVQSLAADPFCMFGVTQETLDEITAIVNFMTPSKESWSFLYT